MQDGRRHRAVQLPPAPPKPPLLGIAPANGSAELNPLSRVSAQVVGGNLTDVSLVDDYGNTLAGALSPDRTSWQPTVPLKYGRTYTMQVASLGASGVPLARTTNFTTATPDNLTQVYLETPGGLPIHEEMRYGIGTIIAARFDERITDKAAAERNLVVTTSPPVKGSWYWVDDKTAHWRPDEVLRAWHDSFGGRATSSGCGSATGFTVTRMPRPPSQLATRTSPSPTTPPRRSVCSTTASWFGRCPRRWARAATRPLPATLFRSGRRPGCTP